MKAAPPNEALVWFFNLPLLVMSNDPVVGEWIVRLLPVEIVLGIHRDRISCRIGIRRDLLAMKNGRDEKQAGDGECR